MLKRDREWFVERVGLAAEADGFTRIAGRMFGYLLLSADPRSLDDLVDALGVSKASVSTDARRLLQRGVLERVGRPGDRRDYYQIAPDFFARLMAYRVERWNRVHELIVEARSRVPDLAPSARERLAYMDAVHDFIVERVQHSLEDWERHVHAHRSREQGSPRSRSGRHQSN